jgi:hypothetical protein
MIWERKKTVIILPLLTLVATFGVPAIFFIMQTNADAAQLLVSPWLSDLDSLIPPS